VIHGIVIKKKMHYWKSLFGVSVGVFGLLGFLIPCLFVTKAYCREKCKSRCSNYRNGGYGCRRRRHCNMNNKNECLNDNTLPINNNSTIGNDNIVTSSTPINNNENACPYRRRCGYGYGKGKFGHCRYGACGMCCPKLYLLLIFATIATGGIGGLVINLSWWFITLMISACLMKRLYCPYRRCHNQRRCGGNNDNNVIPSASGGEEHSNSSGSGKIVTNYSEMMKTDV